MLAMTAVGQNPTIFVPLGVRLGAAYALAKADSFDNILVALPQVESTYRVYGLPLTDLGVSSSQRPGDLDLFKRKVLDTLRPKLECSIFKQRYAASLARLREAMLPDGETLERMVTHDVIGREAADMLRTSADICLEGQTPLRKKIGLGLIGIGGLVSVFAFFLKLVDVAMKTWASDQSSIPYTTIGAAGLVCVAGGLLLTMVDDRSTSSNSSSSK